MKPKHLLVAALCMFVLLTGLSILLTVHSKSSRVEDRTATAKPAISQIAVQPPATNPPAPRSFEFEALGSIVVTNADIGATNDFAVYVRDCNWLIRSTNRASGSVNESGYDGEGVVYSMSFKPGRRIAVGIIESNNVPADKPGSLPFLWQFFCSGCVFPATASGVAKPVYEGSSGILLNPEMRRQARWHKAAEFGPPEEIVFLRQNSTTDSEEKVEAVFRNRTSTLVNGALVPLTGEWVHYRPTSSSTEVETARAELKVSSVQDVCSFEDFRPQPPTGFALSINDRRLFKTSTNKAFAYVSKEGAWPELEEALRIFDMQRRAPARPK